ncbi:MAG: paraquat-inducible protein A [Rhodobacterales bacterium]
MQNVLRGANLALLILFPIAWFAPLMRAGLLPLFGLSEISVITGLQSLWDSDVALALLVTAFALFVPYLKTISLALLHVNFASPKLLPALTWIGKLAMADVFLIALYIVMTKGVGIGKIETMWGLYLFTACILASILISALTAHFSKA